jgi:hypothetical protein
MTEAGIIEPCEGIVPSTASGGVILRVLLGRKGSTEDSSAFFLFSDFKGNFPSLNAGAGFANYTGTWVSGIVFAPFYEGQKFKWKLSSIQHKDSEGVNPDVGCIANIVGWF